MNDPRTEPERPVEERLRRAFSARAESIDIRDLRPAAPPGPQPRRGRPAGAQRPWLRRFALPLASAAALAAAVLGYVAATADGPGSRRVPPANSPSPVGPSPSPTPTSSAPEPLPSDPPRGPHRTAGPSRSQTPSPGGPRPGRGHTPTGTPTARPTAQPSLQPSAEPTETARPGSTLMAPASPTSSNSPTFASS